MAATVPVHVRAEATPQGVRPIDCPRDLPAVIDLIEIGFKEELDPQGKKMLDQMRQATQPGSWLNWMAGGIELNGYVWIEEGRVVGNLSLREAVPFESRGWLIGNVVVHPDYRGRGIGRALMQEAMAEVNGKDGRWVGLEVRADNAVARGLYEHLGFEPVGRTLHMVRPGGTPWPKLPPPRRTWRPSHAEDNLAWSTLAGLLYSRRQQKVLEIRPQQFRFGGWARAMDMWLTGQRERAWLHVHEDRTPRLAVRAKTDRHYRYHVWDIFVHPEDEAEGASEAAHQAARAARRRPAWPVITIVPDQERLVQELKTLGFQRHRTLLQMILEK